MARKKTSQGRKSKKKHPNGGSAANAPADASAPQQHKSPHGVQYGRGSGTGSNAGPVPNLYWGYVSMEQLRACPRFVGLPDPAQLLPLPSLAAARFLRQSSP
ncbi:hypothetical protein Agub_g14355, partial [Astrephomene gubernaculifera]